MLSRFFKPKKTINTIQEPKKTEDDIIKIGTSGKIKLHRKISSSEETGGLFAETVCDDKEVCIHPNTRNETFSVPEIDVIFINTDDSASSISEISIEEFDASSENLDAEPEIRITAHRDMTKLSSIFKPHTPNSVAGLSITSGI